MNEETNLFIEETTKEGFKLVWKNGTPQEAIDFLNQSDSINRLELWSKAHAKSTRGFAPLAFRAANDTKVKASHTFTMFYLGE